MEVDVLAAAPDPSGYYDQRHADGWMDRWPKYKKERVIGIIRESVSAPGARVLEYGCGPGVFAEALKEAAPDLEVHGCDISTVGLTKARQRCPRITFHRVGADTLSAMLGQFDVVYTHHVLEHVHDLDDALGLIAKLLKPGGAAIHIAPSANPGSLEHAISEAAGYGADAQGRFCCDDSSHVRRLTVDQLREACRRHGLVFREAVHANQFWGALDYLTSQHWSRLVEWINPARGRDWASKLRLAALLGALLPAGLLRIGPGYALRSLVTSRSLARTAVYALFAPLALAAWPLSRIADAAMQAAREWEWRRSRRDPRGSEMYCLFEKG